MNTRILLPLFALALMLTACGESATGPGEAGLSLGQSKVQISGGQTTSFDGIAISNVVQSQNYHQIVLSTPTGTHLVGVSTYNGPFKAGSYSITTDISAMGPGQAFAVYGYTTAGGVENYGSTSGTLVITEVTSSGIRGKVTFNAVEADDTPKTVGVQGEFYARNQ